MPIFFAFLISNLFTIAYGQETVVSEKDLRLFAVLSSPQNNSPAQAAGAHGLPHFELGAGLTSIFADKQDSQLESKSLVYPKLWVNKGLPYPFDAGLIFSSPLATAQQLTGYLQWTVFEKFKLPALAVRASHGRLFGLKDVEAQGSMLEATTSWGISIFRGYLSVAYETGGAKSEFFATNREGFFQKMGLKAYILPPFVTTTVETTFQDQKLTSLTGMVAAAL